MICTIHQPQSKIFGIFDSLLILNHGQLIYHGPSNKVLEVYEKAGFPCPPLTNPADHILDVITATKPEDKLLIKENEEKLQNVFTPIKVHFEEKTHEIDEKRLEVPWTRQYSTLLTRTFKEQYRQRNLIFIQLLQSIVAAVLIGTAFLQIGTSQSSTIRRQPVLFFCVVNQGIFGAMMLINSFPSERAIVLRERASGTYKVSAYFMAKITAETVIQIWYPIEFSCVVYWLTGFQYNASSFFIFMVFMVLCTISATSLALMISTICRTTNLAVNILPMALEIARLFGAFFLSPKNIPKYFVWIDAMSYIKYTYIGISLNELAGLELYCTEAQLVNGQCPITTGEQTIENLGLDSYSIGGCIGALILYIFIARVIAFLALKFIKW